MQLSLLEVQSIIISKNRKYSVFENGLVIRSKRNRFSAGGLVLCTVGWCEREVTHVDQTGKEMRVISEWHSENFIT